MADKKGTTAAAKGRKREGDRRKQTKGRDTHAKGITGSEIWFDDIPLESVNMEPGANSSKKASVSLITGLDKRYMYYRLCIHVCMHIPYTH